MLATIGIRLVSYVLLLASVALSVSSTDNDWLSSMLFMGPTTTNWQSATSTVFTATQAMPPPRSTITMITTLTDTKFVTGAAAMPSAQGTLTHPFSSSSSSSSFSSHSSSSSSHSSSSAAVDLSASRLSVKLAMVVLGSALVALF
ncbi:hypothetical protein H4S07_002997 [Coemansia furcata]|uniref:Uncharacterized protein n=1 Tax=Coemansia furcata TaxID=417177 RepID=A0ACC1LJ97_9FUNG|nr:hypothetical protein H4S07_002997 [Coemansia furcata]